jgi:O-antigen/teichoic acid export membrane protein
VLGPALAGAADQALSSGTNVVTSLVAARMLAPEQFGAVVVALSVGTVAIGAQRAFVGDALLATGSAVQDGVRVRMTRDALATAAVIGLLAAGVGLVVGLLPYALTAQVGWMALWLPAVGVQDAYRYAFFCARQPGLALRADAGWAAVQAAILLACVLHGRVGAPAFLTAWGAGGLAGALVGARLARATPFGGRPGRWLRQTRHLSGWFAGQALIAQSHSQLVVFLVGSTLGAAAVGGLRAMQLILMLPALSLLLGLQSLIVPALARRAARGDHAGIRRTVSRLAGGFAVGAASAAAAVAAARVPLVDVVFTARFRDYADLVVPLAAVTICYAACVPYTAACRSLRNARGIFLVQAAFTATTIPAVWVGALRWGVGGSAWGLVLGSVVVLAGTVRTYRRSLARAAGGSRFRPDTTRAGSTDATPAGPGSPDPGLASHAS